MNNFLGDKGAFKSMTAWGVFLYALGPEVIEAATTAGFITASGGEAITGLVSSIATILGGLGIRKVLGKQAASNGDGGS